MKTNSLVILFLVIVLLFAGCNRVNEPSDNSEQSSTVQTSSEKPILKGWKANYTAFLEVFYGNKYIAESDIIPGTGQRLVKFYYKDMDDDGVPELIVDQWPSITVYTFDGDTVVEVGEDRYSTGTMRFLYSNNPSYPGIFGFHLGGGLERYSYMTIKNKQLIYEELWNEDYSGWRENRIEELSDDKEIIRESKRVYEENNDIEWTYIEIIKN